MLTRRERAAKSRESNGVVLFEGWSSFTFEPIVVIATGIFSASNNVKTGPMVQVWILHRELAPHEAVVSERDEAICGNCELRSGPRRCYVVLAHAPQRVFRQYRAGRYRHTPAATLLAGRRVRLGAYGDPAAVPSMVWRKIASVADETTGYTRQWRLPRMQPLKSMFMASVFSAKEAIEARKLGWRTYRVRAAAELLLPFERACPGSAELGFASTCYRCMGCGGAQPEGPGGFAIIEH